MEQETSGLIAAIFDVDGTLINSERKLQKDAQDAFTRLGTNVSLEEIRGAKNWYDLVQKYGFNKDQFDVEFDKRKSWEQSLRDGEAPLFEDTIPCLEELKNQGIQLAILTKSSPEYTKAKLQYHGLEKYFGDRIAVTPVTEKDKVREALELSRRLRNYGVSTGYFIGDSAIDVTVAEPIKDQSNMQTQGIYLNRNEKQVSPELNRYRIIKSLSELPEIMGIKNG